MKAADLTWYELNDVVATFDESELRRLIESEIAGKRRRMFVLRLFSRLNRIRAARERKELLRRING